MSDTNIHAAEMSLADLKRLVDQMEAEQTSVVVETARPLIEHLLTTHTVQTPTKEGSTWVGFRPDSFDITVDGTTYGVSVIVTDRKATQERKDAKAQADKAAKAQEQHGALLAQLAALEAAAAS